MRRARNSFNCGRRSPTRSSAHENLALAEATRQEYDQTIRLTDAKVENGDLARVELYRVQVAAVQYQQAAQQARMTYQQATPDILNALGARAEDVSLANPVGPDSAPNKAQFVKASFSAGATAAATDPDQDGFIEQRTAADRFQARRPPISQTPDELRQIALAERPDVIAARQLYDASTRGGGAGAGATYA
jgi:outer membrane protein TolC